MIVKTRIIVDNSVLYDGVNLYVVGIGPKGERFIGQAIKFVEHSGAEYPDTTLKMRREEVQELVDMLWQIGFRPTEAMGSAGALSATQDHLKTLKEINNRIFKMLEEKPIPVFTELKESTS